MLDIPGFWKPIIEIAILWFVIYHIAIFFEGTRAVHVLRGIIVLSIAFLIIQKLGLERLDWLFTKLFAVSVIALLVIFHPEIRQGLAQLGKRHLFGMALGQEELEQILREILNAAENLSRERIGALIAIENEVSLKPYIESGVKTDALISAELIQTIFTPNSLLHDGGVVIQHNRIVASGCIFPLTENQDLSRLFGTRHRAAIGLSEETDAIVIVISEERGDMTLVYQGKLYQGLTRKELLLKIQNIIRPGKKKNE